MIAKDSLFALLGILITNCAVGDTAQPSRVSTDSFPLGVADTIYDQAIRCPLADWPATKQRISIVGRVTRPDGAPAVDAVVVVRDSGKHLPPELRGQRAFMAWHIGSTMFRPRDVLARTQTDEKGQFSITTTTPEIPPAGSMPAWEVIAVAPSGSIAWQYFDRGDQTRQPWIRWDCNLLLQPVADVSGVVVDQDDRPVADAVVILEKLRRLSLSEPSAVQGDEPSLATMWGQLGPVVRTDEQGRFRIPQLPQGFVAVIQVRSNRHRFVRTLAWTGPGEIPDANIVSDKQLGLVQASPVVVTELDVASRIGRVVDPEDRPVANAIVWMREITTVTETDEEGKFWFPDLSVAEDRKIAEAGLQFNVQARGESDLLPETFSIAADELSFGRPLTFRLSFGIALHGTVRDLHDRTPIPHSDVGVYPLGPNGGISRLEVRTTKSDSMGRYRFLADPAKAYLVTVVESTVHAVHHPELLDELLKEPTGAIALVPVVSDGLELSDIMLPKRCQIPIRTVDDEGEPIAGAIVEMFPKPFDRQKLTRMKRREALRFMSFRMNRRLDRPIAEAVMTDNAGTATVSPRYINWFDAVLTATRNTDGRAHLGTATVDQAESRPDGDGPPRFEPSLIRLRPAATIRGRVLVDAKPASGVSVRLFKAIQGAGRRQQRIHQGDTVTDARGLFRFSVDPDATYVVTAAPPVRFGRQHESQSRIPLRIAENSFEVDDFAFRTKLLPVMGQHAGQE